MKLKLFGLIFLAASNQSFADGFTCSARDSELNVSVYNSLGPATRHAEVMVLSDPTVGYGRQTIARFFSNQGLLKNVGSQYTAKVDTLFPDTSRAGELIAGTKLGQLEQIKLIVDFNYSSPVADGEIVDGLLTLVKKDGSTLDLEMDCFRYLKGL